MDCIICGSHAQYQEDMVDIEKLLGLPIGKPDYKPFHVHDESLCKECKQDILVIR